MLNRDRDLTTKPIHHKGSESTQDYQTHPQPKSGISTNSTIFSEATTRAIALIDAPVAILSTSTESGCQIGSIMGLDRLNRFSGAKLQRELAGLEYCHGQTIESDGVFVVNNFQEYSQLVNSSIYRLHQIQAYLGVTITTAAGDKLGVISILDLIPREFSNRDIELLQLIARLVSSECERSFLSQAQLDRWMGDVRDRELGEIEGRVLTPSQNNHSSVHYVPVPEPIQPSVFRKFSLAPDAPVKQQPLTDLQEKNHIQLKLLTHLAQELRTPLTSVLGMARVLQQEIYGELGTKQKDYLGIIHHSGLQLIQVVDEIAQLGAFEQQQSQLTLKSVDLELLCQLSLQSLEPLAAQKQQQIVIDLLGGDSPIGLLRDRRWLLDKEKVRQIIYYLSSSLIQSSATQHQIMIQVSKFADRLQIQMTTSDPQALSIEHQPKSNYSSSITDSTELTPQSFQTEIGQDLRTKLGLSMSQSLAALHGATIRLTPNGCGYQLSLPLIFAQQG